MMLTARRENNSFVECGINFSVKIIEVFNKEKNKSRQRQVLLSSRLFTDAKRESSHGMRSCQVTTSAGGG